MKFDDHFFNSHQGLQSLIDEVLPQNLCRQTGNCCRFVVNIHTQEQLITMAQQSIPGAQEFLDIFVPYPEIQEAHKLFPAHVDTLLNIIDQDTTMKSQGSTLYYCKHLSSTNQCTIYDHRPTFCAKTPHTGWSLMAAGCGFTGWQFEYREKQKKLIRGLKEHLYVIEMLSEDGITHPTRTDITVNDLKNLVNEKIKPWVQFGAQDW